MNNMQKAFKKKGACGLADGGRPNPNMLGSGMAQRAGLALAGRGQQLARAEAEAMGGAPAPAPASPMAPAGGGLSARRDNAMPPAHMLAAQRRGMADGGLFELEMGGAAPAPAPAAAPRPTTGAGVPLIDPKRVDVLGRPYNPNSPKWGQRGFDKTRVSMHQQQQDDAFSASLAARRASSGLAPLQGGMADGGARGNADEIETGHGGLVRGPGGPTDDGVGPVALSNEEYVLPADTVEAVGEENLDQLRDATHEFVDEEKRPDGLRGLADGGPAAPNWFQKQRAIAATERRAASEVKAGTANPDMRALYMRNQAALDNPAVMNPLSELPGIGLADRGASAAVAATPGIISGLRAGANKVTNFLAAKVGAPKAGSALPGAASQGITNAQRVAATPSGYVTGGLAQPAAKMASGALPTAPRIGANVLATQAAEAGTDAWYGDAQAPAAQAVASPAPSAPGLPNSPEDAGISQALGSMGVSAADQGSDRVTYAQAQGLSRGAPSASKNYRLGGGQYSEGNADIFAGSDRADGTLNNFSGVGDARRPNWEQRNPEAYQSALARAEKDKASVVSIAANYAAQGDREGAYRMAAGDPAATAAVEAAFQQRGLRQAALNGNKGAAEILAQQGRDAAGIEMANITANGAERVGLAKARADMAKAGQDQANSDRDFGLRQNADNRAGAKQRRDEVDSKLVGIFGPQLGKDGALNPAYAEFKAAIDETLLGRTVDGKPDGRQATLEDLGDQKLEQYAQDFKAYKQDNPGSVRGFIDWVMGNSVAETNNLDDMAVKPGSQEEGFFNDTYKTADNRTRYLNDKTLPGLRRAGFLQQGGR